MRMSARALARPPPTRTCHPTRGYAMRSLLAILVLVLCALPARAAKPPVHVWLEPEWFEGVKGTFAYWADGTKPSKPTGAWGIAGPGISAEWSQGGESEWNSLGASAAETSAECHRD